MSCIKTSQETNIMKEEMFGRVVNNKPSHTETEAVQKSDDTEFGLYAAVCTKYIDCAMRFAKALEARTVCVTYTTSSLGRGYVVRGI